MRAVIIGAALAVAAATPALAQDAKAGANDFMICRACHQIGPGAKNAVGPDLNGVVGRKSASEPGFDYSAGLKKLNITWTPENLEKWLAHPQGMVPDTKMIFPGFGTDTKKIKDVIAFLEQYDASGNKK